jgi:hypothetical protein
LIIGAGKPNPIPTRIRTAKKPGEIARFSRIFSPFPLDLQPQKMYNVYRLWREPTAKQKAIKEMLDEMGDFGL